MQSTEILAVRLQEELGNPYVLWVQYTRLQRDVMKISRILQPFDQWTLHPMDISGEMWWRRRINLMDGVWERAMFFPSTKWTDMYLHSGQD